VSFTSVDATRAALAGVGYVADAEIATALYLAARLQKPLLVEGPAGVGKTELAKSAARASGRPLFRVQCYEGLDEAKLLYEWKYAKQLLYTQMLRDQITEVVGGAADLGEAIERIAAHEDAFFSERFLEPRALLAAIRSPDPAVLLIDEVDRAEEELEAFFLEVLAELQVTIPELGTIRATSPPLIVLTSNATRELSDALRRRCLHLEIGFPDADREVAILRSHVPELSEILAAQIAALVARLRGLELKKAPSLSEAIDWARALVLLSTGELGPERVSDSLGLLLKHRADIDRVREAAAGELAALAASK
jgi:MoxR-like ATPase